MSQLKYDNKKAGVYTLRLNFLKKVLSSYHIQVEIQERIGIMNSNGIVRRNENNASHVAGHSFPMRITGEV